MSFQLSSLMAWTTGNSPDINDVYDIDGTVLLGAGSFGKVVKGRSKATGSPCAIKQIPRWTGDDMSGKRNAALNDPNQEADIMHGLRHPHIIQLLETYEDPHHFHLVMELCSGGRLVKFVARQSNFIESDVAHLMNQVLAALKYIHAKDIIHRDVKPDNLLLESCAPIKHNTLKLVDFGLSCKCASGHMVRSSVGTPEFVSPQAIDGRYDTQADMWSCGVSMYLLLCGYVPFSAVSTAQVFDAVRRGNFSFATEEWHSITENAKDLIRVLLKMRPQERYTAEMALDHVWVREEAPGSRGVLQKTLANFRMRSAHANDKQSDPTVLGNFRGVFNEVSQLANSWFAPLACGKTYSQVQENNLEIMTSRL